MRADHRAMTDPAWAPVQMQIRVPFWRRAQLYEKSRQLDMSIGTLLTDAIDRVHPPTPPKPKS